jgi:spermidine synthase
VELVPEVLECLPYFEPFNAAHSNGSIQYQAADARRYVLSVDETFDVIVADLFHPARDGAGSLYTREHFQAVLERLSDGGMFCQWLPLHQMDLATTKTVMRTFLSVFPRVKACVAHFNVDTPALGLIGTREFPEYSATWFQSITRDSHLVDALTRVALNDGIDFFGSFVGDQEELSRFVGEGRVNTDNHPVVMFAAPKFTYGPEEPGYERLTALLENVTAGSSEILGKGGADENPAFARRLDGYLAARDLFLAGAVFRTTGRLDEALDLFLESAQTSRYFRVGYENCLQLAIDHLQTDRSRLRIVLTSLLKIRPDDPRPLTYLVQLQSGQ